MTVYSDYSRDKIGWFFGLNGFQFAFLAIGSLPFFWAIKNAAWLSAGMFLLIWLALAAVTIIPVRGRSATGWLVATLSYSLGGLTGWTRFRSKASAGAIEDLDEPDMPGRLQGLQIHDGPPSGGSQKRIAIIQDHATRSWAVTAAVTHPGIGMAETDERDRLGTALSNLIDVAGRTELIEELIILVRTVPDDGAERELWVRKHRSDNAPGRARRTNDELADWLTQASVRTEQYVTIVVPEANLAKHAKEAGGGLDGRARTLYLLLGEIQEQLVGGLGMTAVNWLTSPELALACRSGFAPGDRAGIIQALAMRAEEIRKSGDSGVNAEVPWAQAGPSGADSTIRHYSHDAWNSVSATFKLPDRGAAMGALAPVLMPSEPGERRSYMVAFPIVRQSKADRQTGNAEWQADLAEGLRGKLGMKERTKQKIEKAKARGFDAKLARGNALTRPYAIATVTVPKTQRIADFGRRLDAAIRRAGFAPMRLDIAHDVAFAASVVPLGVSLTRKGDA